MEVILDGNGDPYEELIQLNSPVCGYTLPDPIELGLGSGGPPPRDSGAEDGYFDPLGLGLGSGGGFAGGGGGGGNRLGRGDISRGDYNFGNDFVNDYLMELNIIFKN